MEEVLLAQGDLAMHDSFEAKVKIELHKRSSISRQHQSNIQVSGNYVKKKAVKPCEQHSSRAPQRSGIEAAS